MFLHELKKQTKKKLFIFEAKLSIFVKTSILSKLWNFVKTIIFFQWSLIYISSTMQHIREVSAKFQKDHLTSIYISMMVKLMSPIFVSNHIFEVLFQIIEDFRVFQGL
jgi:hypothetical protein